MSKVKKVFNYRFHWEKGLHRPLTDEEFDKLFLEQKRFERKRAENDCSACGYGNKGSIFIESSSDIASLIHFGMWSHGTDYYRCTYCGRKTEK